MRGLTDFEACILALVEVGEAPRVSKLQSANTKALARLEARGLWRWRNPSFRVYRELTDAGKVLLREHVRRGPRVRNARPEL